MPKRKIIKEVKPAPDRIDKAFALISAGRVTPRGNSTPPRAWHVESDALPFGYDVTPGHCGCQDRARPCKHLWATEGAAACQLIYHMRHALTVDELYDIGTQYSQAVQASPRHYYERAQKEFLRKRDEIRASYGAARKRAAFRLVKQEGDTQDGTPQMSLMPQTPRKLA